MPHLFQIIQDERGRKRDRFKVPGEDCKRGESSNGVIYTSASAPLLHRDNQMAVKHGRGKSLQVGKPDGGERPAQTVGHHLLCSRLLNAGEDFCFLRLANRSTNTRCHRCCFTLAEHAQGKTTAFQRQRQGKRPQPGRGHVLALQIKTW